MDSKLTPWHQDEWVERTWGELVELKYGKALKDYKDKVTGFPVFGTNGPVGFSETPLCDFPSVIIGRKGAYRGVHYSEVPFYVIDTAFYIAPKFDINLKWAYYELLKQDINGLDSGSAIPSTRREDFYALRVNVPPRPIQDRIADLLDSFNNKITVNRQINQTLEQMAQTLFKSWFVDFDPVIDNALDAGNAIPDELQARAEQRQALRNAATQQGDVSATQAGSAKPLPDNIRQLFPNEFEESELGWVPKGWVSSNVGFVSECFDKHRVPLSKKQRDELKPGIYPYHGATSIMDYVSEFIFDDIYLLIGEDGSVIKEDGTPYYQYIWGKCWVNNHAHVLKGKNGVSTEHLMIFMAQANIKAFVTGAVQMKINQKNMNSIPFLLADRKVNEKFSKMILPLYAKFRSNYEQSLELQILRDTLLPKLISGELRLDEVESTIKETITA
ncbi:restriction endonuclease subunit S [Maribrevibacterium harenarium]|nr:restriction endonuclease subunit S [Maribrevibacterium harenarium]